MRGKCPFNKIKCTECVLYRQGLRYFDDQRKPEPFEECAINIACDCLENMIGRSIGQQKAVEGTRNEIVALKELFYSLATRRALENRQEDIIEVTE